MVWIWVSEWKNWDTVGPSAKNECMIPSIYYEVRSEPILFHNVLWKRVEQVASTFRPPSCINPRHYLAFMLREAVRHMSLSFSFKHIATKVIKLVDMVSCSLIFKLRRQSQFFCMLACTQTPWFVYTNPKKAWKHSLSINFYKFVVVSYIHADPVAVR